MSDSRKSLDALDVSFLALGRAVRRHRAHLASAGEVIQKHALLAQMASNVPATSPEERAAIVVRAHMMSEREVEERLRERRRHQA